MRFLLQLFFTAIAFTTVLPLIHGISFHGGFASALLLAVFFGIVLWVIDFSALAISAVLTISSLGLALLWLIPLWIFGFWLLPAVALKVVADLVPNYLTVAGWTPAVLGGLVMMVVGILTSGSTWKERSA